MATEQVVNSGDWGWSQFKTRHVFIYFGILLLSCLGLFVSNVVQQVFFKRMADDMPSGPYFILVFCSSSFVVVFAICLVVRNIYEKYMQRHAKKLFNMLTSKIFKKNPSLESEKQPLHSNGLSLNNEEEEQTMKPQRTTLSHLSLFIIGALDSVNGLMLLFSGHSTPAALQPILSQSAVPLTFIMSYILIHIPSMIKKRNIRENKTYWKHTMKFFGLEFLASFVVLIGIIITLIPTFQKIHDDPSSLSKDNSALWSLIFLGGVIPGALMNVVQEIYTKKEKNLDYPHLLMWVSIYQIIVDASSFWVNLVVPSVNIHNLSDLGAMFDRGFSCLFDISSANSSHILNSTSSVNQLFQSIGNSSLHNSTPPIFHDGCKLAPVDTFIFIMGYVGTYAFTAILLKMTSSITLILINSFVAPAADIVFFIAGMDELTWFTGVAIVIITGGVLVQIGSDYFKEKDANRINETSIEEMKPILEE